MEGVHQWKESDDFSSRDKQSFYLARRLILPKRRYERAKSISSLSIKASAVLSTPFDGANGVEIPSVVPRKVEFVVNVPKHAEQFAVMRRRMFFQGLFVSFDFLWDRGKVMSE
ncbi:MAG: hypothetical protein MZV70_13550 [Desulfobacterales bacterium]|nr:hypothetical protein [Desulfobacterales bacterium]